MDIEADRRCLQAVFAATATGDGRPFVAALADDVTWTINGSTSWSRVYRGKRAVLDELLLPLAAQLEGRNTITATTFIAEGDRVVVEGRGRSTTKTGRSYDNTYCWIFRFDAGQVVEIVEYADTALIASVLAPPSVPAD